MGAGHGRSRYLNRKEGDAEGRASDWSEVITRRIDGAIRVRSNVDPTFDSLVGSGQSGGTTMAPLFSRIHTSLISVWTAISRAQALMIESCTLTGGSLFLSNREEDQNVPLKDSTETKMGCQERRGGRMGSWSDLDGPAAPGKRIEEASDYFMHAPLGSGGYSSVGRAPLLQLGRCDYGLDV
ncbi:hypothetical protein CQW23_33827 [Capsicum baccatum]|uniref:Uncharacterized protein ycf68 n=1 Tax=Capsicum baccatum TaxID=33114 RepID=A0A2G2V0Q1_CAPBA|nr:hypothetical protein CQW23_33827 [Capsicum baccatum]